MGSLRDRDVHKAAQIETANVQPQQNAVDVAHADWWARQSVTAKAKAEADTELEERKHELLRLNEFLASHLNQRTQKYDAPFTLEAWLALSATQRANSLSVVAHFTVREPSQQSAAPQFIEVGVVFKK